MHEVKAVQVRRVVDTIEVQLVCPCGGWMLFTSHGTVYLTSLPSYRHVCPECGGCAYEDAKYPRIEYVPRELEESKC